MIAPLKMFFSECKVESNLKFNSELHPPFFITSSIFYPDNLHFGVIFLLLDSL